MSVLVVVLIVGCPLAWWWRQIKQGREAMSPTAAQSESVARLRDKLVVFNSARIAAFNESMPAEAALAAIRELYDAYYEAHPVERP